MMGGLFLQGGIAMIFAFLHDTCKKAKQKRGKNKLYL